MACLCLCGYLRDDITAADVSEISITYFNTRPVTTFSSSNMRGVAVGGMAVTRTLSRAVHSVIKGDTSASNMAASCHSSEFWTPPAGYAFFLSLPSLPRLPTMKTVILFWGWAVTHCCSRGCPSLAACLFGTGTSVPSVPKSIARRTSLV